MSKYNEDVRLESLNNTLSPNDAIKAGTVFKTLDKPYKNNVVVSFHNLNEQQKSMLEIQKYSLMVHDLSLYLDVYPNDYDAMQLRKKYHEVLNKEIKNYEAKYPPFSLAQESVNTIPFPWSTTAFPWGDN